MTMPNPVPAIIEAIGAGLDGWQPQSGKELTEFMAAIPDLIDKLGETLKGALTDITESDSLQLVEGDGWPEQADHLISRLGDAHDEAELLNTTFREENDFWIGGDD